jgi:biopolymer transport protein ExbB/TolQ
MDFSILGLWAQMGFIARAVVIILLLMSMYAIGVSLERFLTFKKSKEGSLGFLAALQPLLAPEGNLMDATGLDRRFPDAPLGRVAAVGLEEYRVGLEQLGDKADDAIELELVLHGVGRSMERAKKREIASLSKGLPVLATISTSAPFVGLFGTVFGIITAFQQMADPSSGGGGGLATVSAGIAEALLTTAVGLGVAILAVWFYNYFTTRLDEIGNLVDDASGELTDRLMHKTRAGLGGAGATSPLGSYGGSPAAAASAAATAPTTSASPASPMASTPPVASPMASTPPVASPMASAPPAAVPASVPPAAAPMASTPPVASPSASAPPAAAPASVPPAAPRTASAPPPPASFRGPGAVPPPPGARLRPSAPPPAVPAPGVKPGKQ